MNSAALIVQRVRNPALDEKILKAGSEFFHFFLPASSIASDIELATPAVSNLGLRSAGCGGLVHSAVKPTVPTTQPYPGLPGPSPEGWTSPPIQNGRKDEPMGQTR